MVSSQQFFVFTFVTIITMAKVNSIMKITKFSCEVLDNKFLDVHVCRLKAIKRDVAELTYKATLLEKLETCLINGATLRKYTVYRKFLYNLTFDACDFLKNHNRYPIVNIYYDFIKQYTNMNHSCPYKGLVSVDKLTLDPSKLTLPLPSGEYLLNLNWILNGKSRIVTKIWFLFEEVNKKTGARTYEVVN